MFEIELESIAVRNIRVSTGSRFYFQSQILNVHGLRTALTGSKLKTYKLYYFRQSSRI